MSFESHSLDEQGANESRGISMYYHYCYWCDFYYIRLSLLLFQLVDALCELTG